jgi:hypothetical protein
MKLAGWDSIGKMATAGETSGPKPAGAVMRVFVKTMKIKPNSQVERFGVIAMGTDANFCVVL